MEKSNLKLVYNGRLVVGNLVATATVSHKMDGSFFECTGGTVTLVASESGSGLPSGVMANGSAYFAASADNGQTLNTNGMSGATLTEISTAVDQFIAEAKAGGAELIEGLSLTGVNN